MISALYWNEVSGQKHGRRSCDLRKGHIMPNWILLSLFLTFYCCAIVVLSAVTAPPADPSAAFGDLPPMTVGYVEESVTIDGSPDGYWQPSSSVEQDS